MTPRERFLRAMQGLPTDRASVGNPVSIATTDLMETTRCSFPDVHTDARQMATLAAAGHEQLEYDTVAPYFSVVSEAAAFGARIDWGSPGHMPAVTAPYLFTSPDEIAIPLTGDMCSAATYRDFLLPVHQWLRTQVACPIILHICGHTLDRLDSICQTGFDAFHIDSKNDTRQAVEIVAGRLRLIGNVNNPDTLYHGREEQIDREVQSAWAAGFAVIGPECAVPVNMHSRYLRRIATAAREM